MRKFKLHPKVAVVNANFGLCEDHERELKESDFPSGNAGILLEKGFLIEIKEKEKEKKKEETKK
jgi:hypothetical protein